MQYTPDELKDTLFRSLDNANRFQDYLDEIKGSVMGAAYGQYLQVQRLCATDTPFAGVVEDAMRDMMSDISPVLNED